MNNLKYDYVIAGAGIIGLTIARSLLNKGFKNIVVIEKESGTGFHSTGRNSGVIHSGIYYPTDSMKAQFCATGNIKMRQFADQNNISYHKTGKVIVATDKEQLPQIELLYERGIANSVNVKKINRKELSEIEPAALSALDTALFCADTSVIDPKKVLLALENELKNSGVNIIFNEEITSLHSDKNEVITAKNNKYYFEHFINCAGSHADKIAHLDGVGLEYKILPFKGLYRKLTPAAADLFKGSIYPLPDLRFPFLGVHITRGIYGDVYVGPTAIPALGRENYTLMSGLEVSDIFSITQSLATMYFHNNDNFRSYVKTELAKYTDHGFWKSVSLLSNKVQLTDLLITPKVGIRAQLYNIKTRKLMLDFKLEKTKKSTHILNAISPAFTCGFTFADYVVNQL